MKKQDLSLISLVKAFEPGALERLAAVAGVNPEISDPTAGAIAEYFTATGGSDLFDGLGSEEIYCMDRLTRAGKKETVIPAHGLQSLVAMGLAVMPGPLTGIAPAVPLEIARAYRAWKTGRKVFRLSEAVPPARPAAQPAMVCCPSGDTSVDLLALLLMATTISPEQRSNGSLAPADTRRFLCLAGHTKEDFYRGPGKYLAFLIGLALEMNILAVDGNRLIQGPGVENFLAVDTDDLLLACQNMGGRILAGHDLEGLVPTCRNIEGLLPTCRNIGAGSARQEESAAADNDLFRKSISLMHRYPDKAWIPVDIFENPDLALKLFHFLGYCDIGCDSSGRALSVRVTALGRRRLFRRFDKSDPAPPSGAAVKGSKVTDDFTVHLGPNASRAQVFAAAAFADPLTLRPRFRLKLTRDSILRAFAGGLSPREIFDFLSNPDGGSDFGRIPDKVAKTISGWWNLYGDATILSGNFLLSSDDSVMEEIAGTRSLARRLGKKVTPRLATLADGDLRRVSTLLADRGFMPKTVRSGLPFMPGANREIRTEAAMALVFAVTALSSMGRPVEILSKAVDSILETMPPEEMGEVLARGTEMADNFSIRLGRNQKRDSQRPIAGQPIDEPSGPEAIEAALRIMRLAAERRLPMRVRVLEPDGDSSTVREIHGPYEVTRSGGLHYLHAFTRLFQEKVTLRIDRILFIETLGL